MCYTLIVKENRINIANFKVRGGKMRLEGEKELVTLNDEICSSMFKISKGLPGALNVLMQLGLIDFMRCDNLGIYGQFIWIAFKDICKNDLEELRRRLREDSDNLIQEIKETPDWKYYKEK